MYTSARKKAHEHLLRSFELAKDRFGRVPLGHDIVDARTMNRANIASGSDVFGETAGLPASGHTYANPVKHKKANPANQSEKNKKAGIVVDPTAIETATAGDNTTIDTLGGYGLTSGQGP